MGGAAGASSSLRICNSNSRERRRLWRQAAVVGTIPTPVQQVPRNYRGDPRRRFIVVLSVSIRVTRRVSPYARSADRFTFVSRLNDDQPITCARQFMRSSQLERSTVWQSGYAIAVLSRGST